MASITERSAPHASARGFDTISHGSHYLFLLETGAFLYQLLPFVFIGMLGGLVQGFTGFGFGIVIMALLPLFMDFKTAATWGILANLAICYGGAHLYWRSFRWHHGRWLITGAVLGTPVGIYALASFNPDMLKRLLGGLLLLLPVSEFLNHRRKMALPRKTAFPLGVVGGMLGGAFNIGGPPLVLYAYSQPWPRQEAVATLQISFVLTALLRTILSGSSGILTSLTWLNAACALPFALVALYYGKHLAARWEAGPTRDIINLFMAVMGVKYILFP